MGIDANTSVELGPFINHLNSLGLKEAISTSHSPSSLLATYNCNTRQETIDGIFVTANVDIHSAGLAAFDSPLGWLSDHCLAWIQITKESVLGDYLLPTPKVDMAEFLCGDPCQQERYQQLCWQGCAEHQITKKIKALNQLGVHFLLGETKLLAEILLSYNQIHKVTDWLQKGAVKGLWKKRVGGDPWTPKLQDIIDWVKYWSHVVKEQMGVATSVK